MYLIFDTETTGLPQNWNAPSSDTDNWPRAVQVAWQLHDETGRLVEVKNYIVKPEGYTIPFNAEKIHGISTQRAMKQGMPLDFVLGEFEKALERAQFAVGHNINFDVMVLATEFYRKGIPTVIEKTPQLDSCSETTAELCRLPGGRGGRYKMPKLTELHHHLFGCDFSEAHNASADVEATARCFLELVRIGIYSKDQLHVDDAYFERYRADNPQPFELIGLNVEPYDPLENEDGQKKDTIKTVAGDTAHPSMDGLSYSHLHNHSSYSILQATTRIEKMIDLALTDGMPAVGITDIGNMYSAFNFVTKVADTNKKIDEQNEKIDAGEAEGPKREHIKGVIGCELYVAENHLQKKFTKENPDRRFTQVLFAKNKNGYHNLSKLSSLGYTEGYYGIYPRISKELIVEHREDLIATTGSLSGEVPNLILNVGETQAETAFRWWHELFGDDYYVELLRHGLPEEDRVNEVLLGFAKKYGVKYIAQNNTYYTTQEESKAHDVLICINDGTFQSMPVGYGRGFRFGFPNDEFYLKSQAQMKEIFSDLPEAIANLADLIGKVENYKLTQPILLPAFDIPEQFVDPSDAVNGTKNGENAYLRHLTYEGARRVYGDITPEIKERIDFELDTIARTGYPGYFLIVQDFLQAARKMGVGVGPGRGSAAGSAVAYCIGITSIDPIKYDLLFERFLNPERVSLPDIDIDLDDEGRGKVIEWVVNKYGQNQVAQIITYGTMAAKSSIRDTGRVMELPPSEVNLIAKMVPDGIGIELNKIFSWDDKTMQAKLMRPEEVEKAKQLIEASKGNDITARVINQARVIEGSMRNTGIHACGIIITPSDIREHVPVSVAKDSSLLVTQFDNKVVESAGLLKMDFLGLKTLSLIKSTVRNIKQRHGIDLDPDYIPIDDPLTYELFQRGETVGIFQYESAGMQKYLRELAPSEFSDLIAMNALYRPGPLEYIPSFIRRKHGEEPIVYDLPEMEEYLKETYGVTVYQEQVMLLSQKLAGFTKGEADVLRKAMGKKQIAVLNKMESKFIDQAVEKGHDRKILEKIWTDWKAFAQYAFNKSHSTCYAWVAYQTAYLKANFPAEYMAAVLSNNMSKLEDITFFMEEARRMGINLLCPDINESEVTFTVNKRGDIRFGMGAIKNVGESAINSILAEREANGPFTSIFDFTKRVDQSNCTRRVLENLVVAGAFDSFGLSRAQYLQEDGKMTVLEKAIRYGLDSKERANSSQVSLFGDEATGEDSAMTEPPIPECPEWPLMQKLKREQETVGLYISGHPLDEFKHVLKFYCNLKLEKLNDVTPYIGREISFGGIVTSAEHKIAQNGNGWGIFTLEDLTGNYKLKLFNEDYLKFRPLMDVDRCVYIRGMVMKPFQRADGSFTDPRLKISNIQLLSTVPESEVRKIRLSMDILNINGEFIRNIKKLVEENAGNNVLEIDVFDPRKEVMSCFRSGKFKVAASHNLFQGLEEMGINYQVK